MSTPPSVSWPRSNCSTCARRRYHRGALAGASARRKPRSSRVDAGWPFRDDRLGGRIAPLIAGVRERAERIRNAELARFATSLDALAPSEREAVEALTKGIVAKLLHEPTVRLKDSAGSSQGDRLATSLAELFDL
ncbi:MAG: hypothetical protein R2714_12295 [Microthrixaceae bacterium]